MDGRPLERALTPAVYVQEELSQLGSEFKVICVEISMDSKYECCTYVLPRSIVLALPAKGLNSSVLADRVVGLCTLSISLLLFITLRRNVFSTKRLLVTFFLPSLFDHEMRLSALRWLDQFGR